MVNGGLIFSCRTRPIPADTCNGHALSFSGSASFLSEVHSLDSPQEHAQYLPSDYLVW